MVTARADALDAVRKIVDAERGRQTELAAAVGVSGAYFSDVMHLNRAFGYELAESLLSHLRKRKNGPANGKPLAQGGRLTAAAGNKKDVALPNGKAVRK